MKSKFITLLVYTIFVGFSAYSQAINITTVHNPLFILTSADSLKKPLVGISPSMLVSPSFYSCNLAFFCRQEVKFEKVTKIPFKFRLGSVQQVDYLEGKKGSSPYR